MLELADIQGNILRAYTLPFARFLFLRLDAPRSARVWLAAVVDHVTTAANWGQTRPRSTFNIAFTFSGLSKIGVEAAVLGSFSEAFRQGMAARSRLLGDAGVNAPDQWENQLGATENRDLIHAMISIYGETPADIDTRQASVFSPDTVGVSIVLTQNARQLSGKREHFGFRDGVSQPLIQGLAPPKVQGGGLHRQCGDVSAIAPGEFVLGYPGQGGLEYARPAPPFHKNATYVVYRKLQQHVGLFRDYVREAAEAIRVDPEWLAARMMGRWKDGTPTTLSPNMPDAQISDDPSRVNNFGYADDPRGLRCPLGSHIRRANPRNGLAGGTAAVEGHQLLRRGMPYGDPLAEGAPEDGADRGLLFIACNANLREQFEFVQRLWLNDSAFTGSLAPDQKDPIGGYNTGAGTMTLPMPDFPRQLQGIPDFVRLRFGTYLIAPGLQALRQLSDPTAWTAR